MKDRSSADQDHEDGALDRSKDDTANDEDKTGNAEDQRDAYVRLIGSTQERLPFTE